mgnify:CR=1 FL=1
MMSPNEQLSLIDSKDTKLFFFIANVIKLVKMFHFSGKTPLFFQKKKESKAELETKSLFIKKWGNDKRNDKLVYI